MKTLILLLTALTSVNAYWLMGIEDFITTERLDPIVSFGQVSGHTHSVLGGSNFRMNNTSTANLRQSECTSIPIPEDNSNYWFPHLYFQHANGSFTSLSGGAVIDTPGTTTAFPDDFRMISGDPTLRTYDPTSFAQQAVTFLCLDFDGTSTRYNSLPPTVCPSGVRAQINFPSCWDGKNVDSADHKSHVAFLSTGPDSGTCSDPNFPFTLPRIFMEVYWSTSDFANVPAMNSTQPFVYAYGDPTGYGYHADFLNGWDAGVLQNAVDKCHCDPFGDATCCANQGIFTLNQGKTCRITKAIDEQTTGTLAKLPGNNPVQKEGTRASMFVDPVTPSLLWPIYAYTGDTPTEVGKPITPPASAGVPIAPSASSTSVPSSSAVHSASSSAAIPQLPSSIAVSSSITVSHSSSTVNTFPTTVSSKPVMVITSGASSPAAPSATGSSVHSSSPLPPASAAHSVGHSSVAPAQAMPTSSGSDDDDDCEEEDDDDDDEEPAGSSTAPVPSASIAPPSAGSGSNHLQVNSAHSVQASATTVVPTPATTLVLGGDLPSSTSGNSFPAAASSSPVCSTGKFRHQRLRELKAQQETRSLHHARSFHDRLMRSHRHVRAF